MRARTQRSSWPRRREIRVGPDRHDPAGLIKAEPEPPLSRALAATPPSSSLEVRDVGPLARLYSTPAVHRLLPTAVSIRLSVVAGWLRWRLSGASRERAQRWAASLMPGSTIDEEVARLARRAVIEQTVKAELFWRPWKGPRLKIDGIESLEAIRAEGRGAIVVTPPVGMISTLVHALGARGFAIYIAVINSVVSDQDALTGLSGRVRVEVLRQMEHSGCHLLTGRDTSALRELLERGEICFTVVDASSADSMPNENAGLLTARSVSDLALAAGAPILPAVGLRRGARQVLRAYEPVDAIEFADSEALEAALVAPLRELMGEHRAQIYPYTPLMSKLAQRRQRARRAKQLQGAHRGEQKLAAQRLKAVARKEKLAAKRERVRAKRARAAAKRKRRGDS